MDDNELLRYSRQILLPEIDVEGQERLLGASVLIVGLGGLGCPVALYLAAAGVGHLVLADFDVVDLSNLQRQIAHGTNDIGRPKVESARDAIAEINPGTRITCVTDRLDLPRLTELVSQVDLVIDGTDNFGTRFSVNSACVTAGKPLVSGAAIALEGQIMVYDPALESGPCYQCLYQDASDQRFNCAENGVAAPIVGIIGSIQALEAIKLLVPLGTSLAGFLLAFDGTNMEWRKLKLPRNPHCKACGTSGTDS